MGYYSSHSLNWSKEGLAGNANEFEHFDPPQIHIFVNVPSHHHINPALQGPQPASIRYQRSSTWFAASEMRRTKEVILPLKAMDLTSHGWWVQAFQEISQVGTLMPNPGRRTFHCQYIIVHITIHHQNHHYHQQQQARGYHGSGESLAVYIEEHVGFFIASLEKSRASWHLRWVFLFLFYASWQAGFWPGPSFVDIQINVRRNRTKFQGWRRRWYLFAVSMSSFAEMLFLWYI